MEISSIFSIACLSHSLSLLFSHSHTHKTHHSVIIVGYWIFDYVFQILFSKSIGQPYHNNRLLIYQKCMKKVWTFGMLCIWYSYLFKSHRITSRPHIANGSYHSFPSSRPWHMRSLICTRTKRTPNGWKHWNHFIESEL